MSILFLALMCNLYLAFVAGTSVQDVLAKLVILNFILEQQNKFKQEIFKGNTGRIVLQAIRNSYEYGAPSALAPLQYRRLINLYGKEVTVRKRLMKSYRILDHPPSTNSTKEETVRFADTKKVYEDDVKKEMNKHYEKMAEQQMKKEGWLVKQAQRNIERIETWERVVRSRAEEVLRDPRRARDAHEILMASDKNNAMQAFMMKMCKEYVDAEQKNAETVDMTLRDHQKPKEVDVYRKNIFEETKRLAKEITYDQYERMEDVIMRLNVAMIRVIFQEPAHQYQRKYAFLSRREQLVANYKASVAVVSRGMGVYAKRLFTFKKQRINQNGILRTIAEKSLLFLGVFPVWVAAAFVIYAPICKPGPTWVISVNPSK